MEPDPSPQTRRSALGVRVIWGFLLLSTCLLGGEVAARLDDSLFHGVPFFANPSDDDLTTRDWFGRRGRSHGQFGKWKLNSLGFHGPEITVERTPGCARMVVMGASETFGYRESPGREFPRLLGEKLAARGCVEVVNAAVAGMTLGSMQRYWTYWVARLRPDVVLIYPSPLFYLEYTSGQQGAPLPVPSPAPPPPLSNSVPDAHVDHPFESRFISRLRGVAGAAAPRWLTMYRVQRQVRAKLAALPAIPEISAPPQAGLAAFRRDLNALVESIRSSGARVVLLTHAERAGWPIARRDLLDLWASRVFWPHAALPEFVEFDRAGNTIIRETAGQQTLQLIDAAAVLNGCFDCFGDLVHFNDKGAEIMASLIAEQTRIPGP
jgi:lysophospholipase L1-like esterase